MAQQIVKNSNTGKAIELTEYEVRQAVANRARILNDFGFDISTTTLTAVVKQVLEQKFFTVPPADYVTLKVGEGAWKQQLLTFQSYSVGGDFATGVINTGSHNARLAQTDAALDSVVQKIRTWAKANEWSLPELNFASSQANWDIVTAKEQSRKENWDLGIQKTCFLGLTGDPAVKGLLTQTGVTTNTTLITKPISTMTGTELKAFIGALLGTFRTNASYTSWPDVFVVPESDYTGLAAPSSADYPLKSVLQVLEETLQTMSMNKAFKIMPLAYADNAVSGLGVQKYALYNKQNVIMNIPVDYTPTAANTINGFQFQNVAYGQFTGVQAYRAKELMYFTY